MKPSTQEDWITLRNRLNGIDVLALLAMPIRGCMVDNERFREVRSRWDHCSRIIVPNGAVG